MQATITKIQDAQPMGEYKNTSLDLTKNSADFLVIDVSCPLKVIDWKNGKREKVTAKQLKKLQSIHSWATNF